MTWEGGSTFRKMRLRTDYFDLKRDYKPSDLNRLAFYAKLTVTQLARNRQH